MLYEPKHCNQCGDKIERASRNWLTSRRFCDLCATDFGALEWTPRIIIGAAIIIIIATAGNFLFSKPEKNLIVSSNQPSNILSNSSRNSVSQVDAPQNNNSTVSQTANNKATAQAKPATIAAVKPVEKIKSSENQSNGAQETVYFCGAQTKKGTPCTRRVKGGGRCWQHVGQPALLPPEKLIANK